MTWTAHARTRSSFTPLTTSCSGAARTCSPGAATAEPAVREGLIGPIPGKPQLLPHAHNDLSIGAVPETRPGLPAVLRRIALSLVVATVVPSVAFYLCVLVADVWVALVVALSWCYAALAWRLGSGRRTSALLWVVAFGLTLKTTIAFATGSTFLYFVQPALSDVFLAAGFLWSLTTTTPAVTRLAGDFYPMTPEISDLPRVKQLFRRLTLMWSCICGAKAAATLWMLHSLSLSTFVATKAVVTPTVAILGAGITVCLAVRVARREALIPVGRRQLASVAISL